MAFAQGRPQGGQQDIQVDEGLPDRGQRGPVAGKPRSAAVSESSIAACSALPATSVRSTTRSSRRVRAR
jgi:hypothetical protein